MTGTEAHIPARIQQLKKEKNALILAHYYQEPAIQALADFVGDSYALSKIAKESKETTIVFCGVRFMAESVKILSPQKSVRLPVQSAGCPMADMADAKAVCAFQKQYATDDTVTVCYINSSAAVKALCDVCVTSTNALRVINKLTQTKILFLPDQNLARYIAGRLKEEDDSGKEIIAYPGYCPIHNSITTETVAALKQEHPAAPVIAHPECPDSVLAAADFIGSTAEMLYFVQSAPAQSFIVLTEEGIRYQLALQNSEKRFYFPQDQPLICADMKKPTPETVLWALEDEAAEITLDPAVAAAAAGCLRRMHELG